MKDLEKMREKETSPLLEESGSSIQGTGVSAVDLREPIPWKKGTSLLANVSLPVITTFVLEMFPGLVNVMAVGRLGEVELAAVALGSMFCNVTGISLGFGMATAMDTLCSQAYGANNKKGLGVILQRGLLIELLLCLPILLIWYFTEPLLILMGQDPEVSELAGRYCIIMMISLYPLLIYEVLKKFLQTQQIVIPQMAIALISNVYTVFANWFFIYELDLGFNGAPLARMSTYVMLPILAVLYIVVFKKYEDCWDGFSKEAFKGWRQFLELGIPGMLMICLEWWAFEIMSFLAGILGTTQLAAHSIILNVCSVTFFLPYGAAVAASIIIGNLLGERDDVSAKRIAQLSLLSAACIETVNCLLLIFLRDYIPMIFTNDPDVQELASSIFPLAAAFQIFDGFAAISGGILRGCGRQKIGAAYNFAAYYLIGLPAGACFTFLLDLDLLGLWLGLAVALALAALLSVTIVLRTDWKEQVENAVKRVDGID